MPTPKMSVTQDKGTHSSLVMTMSTAGLMPRDQSVPSHCAVSDAEGEACVLLLLIKGEEE